MGLIKKAKTKKELYDIDRQILRAEGSQVPTFKQWEAANFPPEEEEEEETVVTTVEQVEDNDQPEEEAEEAKPSDKAQLTVENNRARIKGLRNVIAGIDNVSVERIPHVGFYVAADDGIHSVFALTPLRSTEELAILSLMQSPKFLDLYIENKYPSRKQYDQVEVKVNPVIQKEVMDKQTIVATGPVEPRLSNRERARLAATGQLPAKSKPVPTESEQSEEAAAVGQEIVPSQETLPASDAETKVKVLKVHYPEPKDGGDQTEAHKEYEQKMYDLIGTPAIAVRKFHAGQPGVFPVVEGIYIGIESMGRGGGKAHMIEVAGSKPGMKLKAAVRPETIEFHPE